MKSMTGYGYGEEQSQRYSISVEIKSYNNRFLDLVLNMPPAISALEERVRDIVRERCSRGRVEAYIRFRDNSEELNISLDEANIKAYRQVLERLRELGGISQTPALEHFLSMEGLVRIERNRDLEESWNAIAPVLNQALDGLNETREKEGAAIREDLFSQLDRIVANVSTIEKSAPNIEENIRTGLRQRFAEVLGDIVDEQRMLAEVAVQLNRLTINEELVRLRAHIASVRTLMTGNEAAGKKLDFFCQEMNREINTVGSKNVLIEIGNSVIEVKDALENIREQIRNVE